jgi:hypothetical protein
MEYLAHCIPHHQPGLAILEPVLHQNLGRFFQQPLEQSLRGEADFLFFGLPPHFRRITSRLLVRFEPSLRSSRSSVWKFSTS